MREDGVQVGVAAILINKKSQILLGKRKNTDCGNGKWGLPGGGMKRGETSIGACIREVKEETNININVDEVEFVGYTNDFIDGVHQWLTLYYCVFMTEDFIESFRKTQTL